MLSSSIYRSANIRTLQNQKLANLKRLLPNFLVAFSVLMYFSCSKSSPGAAPPTIPPPSTGCSGVTITVTASVTGVTAGSSNGIINATGSGSSNFTYSLNGGSFQSSGNFTGLAAGSYTVTAKNSNGCTGSAQFTVGTALACAGTPGPLFNAVKQVVAANCATSGCHAGPTPQNGLDFTNNCVIVDNSARIKARAVDGIPSVMPPPPNPPLSTADKQKIVAWINAGGQLTN